MVPTKRFWALGALGIPIAALAAVAGSPFLGVAYNLLLLGAAWLTTRMAPSGKDLKLERRRPFLDNL